MSTGDHRIATDATLQLILTAIQALEPGLVTTAQAGKLAPDAEAIENGFIKLATSSNKGLMSRAFAALLESPDKVTFYANSVTGNAGFHNSIYRGKYLGNAITNAQSAAIRAGTFDDLFVGDYWTINSVDWVIVGFDIRYNIGDTALTTHHVGVMPRTNLYSTKWNETNNTVTGGVNGGAGYVGSSIRANIKSSTNGSAEGAEKKVIAAFGSNHVLVFREIYPSTYDSSGNATGLAWVDAKTELLSEVDVYGCPAWSVGGKGYEIGADKSQLPIFRLRPDFANIRAAWWLRSVHSATNACGVYAYGNANGYGASNGFGVRPLSLIA